jgi:hypothetical protein
VQVALCEVSGREVRVVAYGDYRAGLHLITVDGSGLASGVYLVRLRCNGSETTAKVVLMK